MLYATSVWNWDGFGPNLLAGLITVALGGFIAFRVFRAEQAAAERSRAREFVDVARQVLADLNAMLTLAERWSQQMTAAGGPIDPVPAAPLTWESIPDMHGVFVLRGAFRAVSDAIRYYRAAAETAAQWNAEAAGTGVEQATKRIAMLRVTQARARIEAAQGVLEPLCLRRDQ
ncbi:MAG: hypothetical protein EPO65_11740 [Dehalococcoidia bacterium]|nr:MAG: hypothetical protein EPO65_11740 [Dehalococcoidia bacterium]